MPTKIFHIKDNLGPLLQEIINNKPDVEFVAYTRPDPSMNDTSIEIRTKKIDPKVILVIEDDETMRAAMKKIFELDGYVVKLAAEATELSQALDEATPDLILLDVGLPWLNGFELAQMLKEHKELKKIPIVFVSGKTSEEDVKKAFEIGADDYIKKPFEIDKLKKSVETLLKLNRK